VKNRDLSLDLLRILSAISVITIHVSGDNWNKVNVHSFEWQTFNFYESLVRFSVVAFVMISGVFLLDASHKLTLSDLYKKKILRFVLMFIVWSLFYNFIFSGSNNFINNITDSLLESEGTTHLWFLKMIIGLYILVPILRKVVSDAQVVKYFLFIYVAFLFIYQLGKLESTEMIYEQFFTETSMLIPLGFIGYFIAGYYFKRMINLNKKARTYIYMVGIAGFIITLLGSAIVSHIKGTPTELLYDNLTPNVAMATLGIFTFFNYRVSKIKFSDKTKKIITNISECTLGIYLLHPLFIYLLGHFGINTLSVNPILSVPIIVLTVLILSLASTALLKQIPIINKYIV